MDEQLQCYLADRTKYYPIKTIISRPDKTTIFADGGNTVRGLVYPPYIDDSDLATTSIGWIFTALLLLVVIIIIVSVYGFAFYILGDAIRALWPF